VPLALALANISNPRINVMDLLVKLSHDDNVDMCHRTLIAMGLIGAGTNNSRLADILRNLNEYFNPDTNEQFLLRIS